jgi:hypothetical protein
LSHHEAVEKNVVILEKMSVYDAMKNTAREMDETIIIALTTLLALRWESLRWLFMPSTLGLSVDFGHGRSSIGFDYQAGIPWSEGLW